MGRVISLNRDWRFRLGDGSDLGFMGLDDRGWRRVTLPHDWAVEHPFDVSNASGTGYLPGGTAWYRKHFELTEQEADGRVRITFQGVYKHASLWINSNYLGQHAYGYTSFTFDLSDFVRAGENVIAVRVEHNEVADSRWYTGSGIDRPVTLEICDRVCFAENGIFAVPGEGAEQEALLRVRYRTLGAGGARFRLLDREGNPAGEAEGTGAAGEVLVRAANARRWSPEDPYLYTLEGEAILDGEVRDTVRIPVGLRTFRFDPDHGFFLNGVNRKLKGVCVHHDAGCLGAAVPKQVWRRRLEKLRAAGCDALRTSHNPPDPALLDLCDEMGILVMDEAFDEWEGIKNKWWQGHNVYPPKHFGYGEDFPLWHEKDLRSMVERDRNHPCVIMWSIGNEIDYPNDPYVTPLFREVLGNNDANKPLAERLYDVRKPDASRLATVARELTEIVHGLDDSRPVTSALSFPELSNRTGYADVLDLSGYNYREHFYEEDHRTYPDRVILGSENSHDPKAWRAVRDHEYISAQFLWTGIDFLGECQGWPLRISQAGMMNLAGFDKPLYWQRKALWTEEPMAKLAVGDAGEDRGAWGEGFRWEGQAGESRRVSCYTNAGEAELFLNGRSLGRKQLRDEDGCRVCWEVPYEAGTLKACVPGAEDVLTTPGEAAELLLCPDAKNLPAEGREIVQVEVYLKDGAGNPARDEIIRCQVLGDLEILGIENGRPDDLTPYSEHSRLTLEGRAIIYVRAGAEKGRAEIHVSAGGLHAVAPITLS